MDIDKVLLKKATGYTVTEVVTEYVVEEDGTRRAVREKKQKKHIPPDATALKTVLERTANTEEMQTLTDEELEKEKQRLLSLLKDTNDDEG